MFTLRLPFRHALKISFVFRIFCLVLDDDHAGIQVGPVLQGTIPIAPRLIRRRPFRPVSLVRLNRIERHICKKCDDHSSYQYDERDDNVCFHNFQLVYALKLLAVFPKFISRLAIALAITPNFS